MAVTSCSYNLAAANTYATPEKAIEGILKETEEVAKNFSSATKLKVEGVARSLAETAKQLIAKLATELDGKIQAMGPEAQEEERRRAIRGTWIMAETMRDLCLFELEEVEHTETLLKKVGNIKSKIIKASLERLVADA